MTLRLLLSLLLAAAIASLGLALFSAFGGGEGGLRPVILLYCLGALVAGVYPAFKAGRVSPVESIKLV